MCDVRAQLPKIKSNYPKPRNTSSPNSGKNISSHTTPLTVTHPLIPSQEGKHPHHKPLITNKKAASQISPLERGRGCVTPEHSHLKPKAVTQSPRNTSSSNSSKNTSTHTAHLTITHPSIPSQEGKHTHSNHSLPTRKQRQNLPYREGPGVCDVQAQLPKIKTTTRSLRNTSSPNNSKNTSAHTASLTVTHPSIPSQEGKHPRHKSFIIK